MRKTLLQAVDERPLVGDGAMGTQLMLAGLEQGGCGEAWNLSHADRVLAMSNERSTSVIGHIVQHVLVRPPEARARRDRAPGASYRPFRLHF